MPVLYLHGFRSTPLSKKAEMVAQYMKAQGRAEDYLCPQLPASPREAAQLIHSIAMPYAADELSVIGSSLGGFYATWLAEQTGCRAVLLNPAVHPERDLEKYIGMQSVYGSDETIEVKPEFMQELRDLSVPRIAKPERYFLVAATGDEVLDWREMAAKYPGAQRHIIQGSDHGLSDFDSIIDEVISFALNLSQPSSFDKLRTSS